jgi:hypothetical protein
MDDQIAGLLQLIDERERSTRLVLGARASDERHRLLARRYLQALHGYREALRACADEPAPHELLEVQIVAEALGVRLQAPAR